MAGSGLGEHPKFLGPHTYSKTVESNDFKFDKQLGFG